MRGQLAGRLRHERLERLAERRLVEAPAGELRQRAGAAADGERGLGLRRVDVGASRAGDDASALGELPGRRRVVVKRAAVRRSEPRSIEDDQYGLGRARRR